jgi:hypothetical protein
LAELYADLRPPFWLPAGVWRACVSLTPRCAHWVAAVGEHRANLFAEPRLERGGECGAPATPGTKARDQSARWTTHTGARSPPR